VSTGAAVSLAEQSIERAEHLGPNALTVHSFTKVNGSDLEVIVDDSGDHVMYAAIVDLNEKDVIALRQWQSDQPPPPNNWPGPPTWGNALPSTDRIVRAF
jgi:hypothetical protein